MSEISITVPSGVTKNVAITGNADGSSTAVYPTASGTASVDTPSGDVLAIMVTPGSPPVPPASGTGTFAKLGIGTGVPTTDIPIYGKFDNPAITDIYFQNVNPSGAAGILVGMSGVQGQYGGLWHFGSTFPELGPMFKPNRTFLEGQGANGLAIITPSGPILFSPGGWGVQGGFFGSTFAVGTETPSVNAKIHAARNWNGANQIHITNSDSGPAAQSWVCVGKNANTGKEFGIFAYTNSGFAADGILKPRTTFVRGLDDGGVTIAAESINGGISLVTGGYQIANERLQIAPNGAITFKAPSIDFGNVGPVIANVSGGSNVDVEARATLNQLLDVLRTTLKLIK